jgi:hypothetical protein
MKANNYLVTWTDLSTMGLTARGTPPTGLAIANKAELIAAYYVDQSASPFSTYASNRCPRYQDIIPLDIPSLTVWGARDGYGAYSNNAGLVFINYSGLSTSDVYNAIGASNDGVYVCISKTFGFSDNGAVLVSSNSGASWTSTSFYLGSSPSSVIYGKVSVSNSGQYMLITLSYNPPGSPRLINFYKSTNYGSSWTPINGFNTGSVGNSGMSQNGRYQAFVWFLSGGDSYRYYSTNFGLTWTNDGPNTVTSYTDIKMSSTGLYQILSGYDGGSGGGRIYVSSNSGGSFTQLVYDATYSIDFVAMTDDGVYQIGMGKSGKYYISTDYGATFSITGIFSGGIITSIAMTAYNYSSTPYIMAYSSNQAYVYISKSPFSSWSAVPIDNIISWNNIQSRAIVYPYTPELIPLEYSYTLYYDYNDTLPVVVGFTIPEDACSAVNSFTVYSDYSPISIGATLYYDIYGTTEIEAVPSSAPSQNYYAIGNNIIQFSDNYTIDSITSCPVYAGDVWFGTYSGEACSESSPQQYLYWEGSQLFYNGLVLYTDMDLLFPYNNTSGYTYCRSDGSGGGFDEFNLSGNTLGSATGVAC